MKSRGSALLLLLIVVAILIGLAATIIFFSSDEGTTTFYRSDIIDFWNNPFWANILDKPTTFNPSSHSHTLSSLNISNWGTYINQAVLTTSHPTFTYISLDDGGYYPRVMSAYPNTPLYIGSTDSSSGNVLIVGKNDVSNPANLLVLIDYSGNVIFKGGLTIGGNITITSGNKYVIRSSQPNYDFISYGVDGSDTQSFVMHGYATGTRWFKTMDGGSSYTLLMNLNTNGDLSLDSGKLVAPYGVITKYMAGDYAIDWSTISLPTGTNGLMVIAYNSNAGVLASRLYVYSNSVWRYIDLI